MTLRSSTVRRRALPRVSWGRAGVYPLLAVITFILLALAALAFAWSGTLSAWRLGPPWTPSGPSGTILLESSPDGARVEVDAQNQGSTPARVAASPGTHHVALRLEGYMPTSASVHVEENAVTTVSTHLWLATARGQRVRAVFPGAAISQASFLGDGNVALILQLPSAGGREVWVADPSGQVRRVGPVSVVGSVAASSDGKQVAYLNGKASSDPGGQRLGEVWVVEAGGEGLRELYELPTSATNYRLSDLSWMPDGKRVLLVSSEQSSGGPSSTHFVSLDVSTGATDEVLAIPSEVVEGSLAWSPDGNHVAFLTRSGGAGGSAISLCLLYVESGDFRYLADIGRDDQGPLPFIPLSWSPDGQSFVYSAPEEGATQSPSLSLSLLGGKPPQVLYRGDLSRPRSERIGAAEGQSPVWRSDRQLLALVRPNGGGPLVVRAVDPSGKTTDVGQAPLRVQGSYSVLWDAPHAQALIAFHSSADLGNSSTELWWLHFRPEVDR